MEPPVVKDCKTDYRRCETRCFHECERIFSIGLFTFSLLDNATILNFYTRNIRHQNGENLTWTFWKVFPVSGRHIGLSVSDGDNYVWRSHLVAPSYSGISPDFVCILRVAEKSGLRRLRLSLPPSFFDNWRVEWVERVFADWVGLYWDNQSLLLKDKTVWVLFSLW